METTDLSPEEVKLEQERELEKARAAEMDALKEQSRQNELARVRAEAALEERRKVTDNQTQAQPAITEEQWIKAEAETGLTRQQIIAQGQMMDGMLGTKLAPMQKALEEANRKTKDAEEKLARLESRGTASVVETQFYDSNAALRVHKDKVDEFVSLFPESETRDPEKLKVILERAKTYVRGAVGGKVRDQRNGSQGSARLSGGWDQEDNAIDKNETIDYTGLDDKHQRRTVEDIVDDTRNKLSERKDLEKLLKERSTSDGRGVTQDTKSYWDANDLSKRKK